MDHDEWTSCPYDSSHRVPRSRIQYHIIKCQKSRPSLQICPYNATHRYPADQFKDHCKNCPERPVEQKWDKNVTSGMITVPKPILQEEYLPESDPNHECWDDEIGCSHFIKFQRKT